VNRYALATGALVALIALLAGCSRPVMQATKADMSSAKRDHYQCVQESSISAGGTGFGAAVAMWDAQRESDRLYRLCMEARGYTVTEH
jgi:hypothetical protein